MHQNEQKCPPNSREEGVKKKIPLHNYTKSITAVVIKVKCEN